MSLGPDSRQRSDSETHAWYHTPVFPNGCKSWKDFYQLASENVGKPFVMVITSLDGHPYKSITKYYFFGVMNVGKEKRDYVIGINCMTTGFCVEDEGDGFHLFEKGLDCHFFGLKEPRLHGYKIYLISFDPKDIEDLLRFEMNHLLFDFRENESDCRWFNYFAGICEATNSKFLDLFHHGEFPNIRNTIGQMSSLLQLAVERELDALKPQLEKRDSLLAIKARFNG